MASFWCSLWLFQILQSASLSIHLTNPLLGLKGPLTVGTSSVARVGSHPPLRSPETKVALQVGNLNFCSQVKHGAVDSFPSSYHPWERAVV